ncbi:unnamed protein product [Clavelina lepadiformis]|uniref:TIR domain-containing protein n=1 Tax=Clavelina lepadiformis TaxID=159417 RepID=A0ABP0FVA1_CLALP
MPLEKTMTSKWNSGQSSHIMISYNWNDSKMLAHKINDRLGDAGFEVWIDKGQMKGDIFEKMAQGVENAHVFLMFQSPMYESSEHCKREATFAAELEKIIIPIRAQEGYKPGSRLRLLTAGRFYHDFSKGSFDENFKDLLDELNSIDGIEATKNIESKIDRMNVESSSSLATSTGKRQNDRTVKSKQLPESSANASNAQTKDGVKKKIRKEILKSQLVQFENLKYGDWKKHGNKRKYISLLCEISKRADIQLIKKAEDTFPRELNLNSLKLSSLEAAIFCDVLKKQQNNLEELYLINCFSPDDVERLISAISEMPGKVKELNIDGNIITDIPGTEFFAKIEKSLGMDNCFEYKKTEEGKTRRANNSEKQKIQLVLDQLHGSKLEVRLDLLGDVILRQQNG